jgi:hypothetical protein
MKLAGKTLKNIITDSNLNWAETIEIQPNGITFLTTKM